MPVSAATHSAALATAPAPKRLHYGEMGAENQRQVAMRSRAIELLENVGGEYATPEKTAEVRNTLKAEFGIDEHNARSLTAVANSAIHKKNYGDPTASLRNTPATFASPDAAKALARDKMDQLEYGVQLYNNSVKSWSVEKMQAMWTKQWQGSFEHRMLANGGDEAEAIKFADAGLKKTIEMNGAVGGDNYEIRLGLGGLQAGFGALPANLLTENADGTLTINYDSLKNTSLGNYLNIGSHIGQEVDKAA